MTDTDPLEDDVIRAVAEANDVELDPLETAVADHQRTMRENPGVEDLVYEWRKQYDDPVLLREPDVFVVAVPPTVWDEYGSYLDLEEEVLQALVAVHQEQTLRTDGVDLEGLPDGHATVVVGR
jgi:hypothetical protein